MNDCIRISKDFVAMECWREDRPSKRQCFEDLLLMLDWERRKVRVHGEKRTVEPGQVVTSSYELGEKWMLPRRTVRRFLEEFEKNGLISIRSFNKSYTVITVRNFEKYLEKPSKITARGLERGLEYGLEKTSANTTDTDIYSELSKNRGLECGLERGLEEKEVVNSLDCISKKNKKIGIDGLECGLERGLEYGLEKTSANTTDTDIYSELSKNRGLECGLERGLESGTMSDILDEISEKSGFPSLEKDGRGPDEMPVNIIESDIYEGISKNRGLDQARTMGKTGGNGIVKENEEGREENEEKERSKEKEVKEEKEEVKEQNLLIGVRKKFFRKPTIEEVRDYIQEKNYSVDAETFVDYYEENGWTVKGKPMKNWKQSVVTWESLNRRRWNNGTTTKKVESVYDGCLR